MVTWVTKKKIFRLKLMDIIKVTASKFILSKEFKRWENLFY